MSDRPASNENSKLYHDNSFETHSIHAQRMRLPIPLDTSLHLSTSWDWVITYPSNELTIFPQQNKNISCFNTNPLVKGMDLIHSKMVAMTTGILRATMDLLQVQRRIHTKVIHLETPWLRAGQIWHKTLALIAHSSIETHLNTDQSSRSIKGCHPCSDKVCLPSSCNEISSRPRAR